MNGRRRSTGRVLAVLTYLASQAEPVSVSALSRECAIPKQTLYPMLHDMSSQGFAVHFPDSRRWGLGIAAFEIGSAYLRSEPLQRLGRPVLAQLTGCAGETSHLAVLHGNEVLYLLKNSPDRLSAPLVSDVGVRLPAHLTAVGRAMLMRHQGNQLRALYPSQDAFVRRTGRGSSRLSELHALLRADRARGHSIESDETSEGITCIAAPILDPRQLPIAAVGISFETSSRAVEDWAGLADKVCGAADTLTMRIHGHRFAPTGESKESRMWD